MNLRLKNNNKKSKKIKIAFKTYNKIILSKAWNNKH